MCLVRGWLPGFFVSAIAPWLSPRTKVGLFCLNPSCLRSWQSQIASWQAWVTAMYSASVDESAGVFWSLLLQQAAAPHARKTNPPVDCWVSRSLAQSESEYPKMNEVISLAYLSSLLELLKHGVCFWLLSHEENPTFLGMIPSGKPVCRDMLRSVEIRCWQVPSKLSTRTYPAQKVRTFMVRFARNVVISAVVGWCKLFTDVVRFQHIALNAHHFLLYPGYTALNWSQHFSANHSSENMHKSV